MLYIMILTHNGQTILNLLLYLLLLFSLNRNINSFLTQYPFIKRTLLSFYVSSTYFVNLVAIYITFYSNETHSYINLFLTIIRYRCRKKSLQKETFFLFFGHLCLMY